MLPPQAMLSPAPVVMPNSRASTGPIPTPQFMDTPEEARPYDAALASVQRFATSAQEYLEKTLASLFGLGGRQPILVTSNSLGDVLDAMVAGNSPAVYDFQGRTMQYLRVGNPTILSKNVTWRNGTIALTKDRYGGQSLGIESTGVVLTSITLGGGGEGGVKVVSGGCLTMTDCKVRDCFRGVQLEGNAVLVAKGLRVQDCSDSSFSLCGNSIAEVWDVKLIGASQGVHMTGDSSLNARRMQITCTSSHAVSLHNRARFSMKKSAVTGNDGQAGAVWDEAVMVLSRSVVEGGLETHDRATLNMKR